MRYLTPSEARFPPLSRSSPTRSAGSFPEQRLVIEPNAVYKKELLLLLPRCKLKQRGQLRSQPNKLRRYEPFACFRHEKMVNGKTVLLSLIWGSLSNATVTAVKTSLKKWICVLSNFITSIWNRLICQMHAKCLMGHPSAPFVFFRRRKLFLKIASFGENPHYQYHIDFKLCIWKVRGFNWNRR